jgi:hypothetical protein
MDYDNIHKLAIVYATIRISMGILLRNAHARSLNTRIAMTWAIYTARTCLKTTAVKATYQIILAFTTPMSTV